jgi:transcriptional regulator ATRX
MVVCPLGTVLNWENEFKIWLPGDSFKTLNVCEVAKSNDKVVMERKILRWFEIGGVLIIGYDTYRMVTKVKKQRSEQEERLWQALVASGPDLLVCGMTMHPISEMFHFHNSCFLMTDEGHLLKNEDTLLYKALNRISTRRRIMLSGTPLQNNLMEFFSMVQFVNRGLLGTNTQFEENFVKVFVKGQTVDSELSDVRAMKVRSFILHKTLESNFLL